MNFTEFFFFNIKSFLQIQKSLSIMLYTNIGSCHGVLELVIYILIFHSDKIKQILKVKFIELDP